MPIPRRTLLAGAAGAFAVAGCAKQPAPARTIEPDPTPTPKASPSADPVSAPSGPFGLRSPSTIRVAAAASPLALGAVTGAIDAMRKTHPEVTVQVTSRIDVESVIDWEDPPDLVVSDGAIPLAQHTKHLLELRPLLSAKTPDDVPLRRSLYTGALAAGSVGRAQMSMQYSLIAQGLWFSESLFTENGWKPPRTWSEVREIASEAPGRYAMGWDAAAADDFVLLALTSAIKQGGDDVRLELERLSPTSWHAPEIAAVFEEFRGLLATKQLVETTGSAQGTWAVGKGPLFCPAGGDLLRSTKAVMASGFRPRVAAVPTMTLAPQLPPETILTQSRESFMVPRRGKNTAGALELLRVMFSRDVAGKVIRENRVPTMLRGALPQETLPALDTQVRLIEAAGTNIVNWRFIDHYGLRKQIREAMAEFLRGDTTTSALITQLQGFSDAARNEPGIAHLNLD